MGKIRRDSQPAEAAVREALIHLKRYAVMPEQRAKSRRTVGSREVRVGSQ
jgi:hypothetical protein